jgi:hypothetical protein
VLYLGQSKCGLKLNELAELCGMNNYAAAAMAIRRYKARLASDKAEARRMNEVIELLNVKM